MARKMIKAKKRAPVDRPDKFDVEFSRNGEPYVQTFQPLAVIDAAALSMAMRGSRRPDQGLEGMLRFIRKMLADDDGVPANWEPKLYRQADPDPELAAAPADDNPDADRPRFMGPDGHPHTYDDLGKFQDFDAGSSRRRWAQLMDNDDDLIVDPEVLQGVFEHLAGLAAGRPTQRPS